MQTNKFSEAAVPMRCKSVVLLENEQQEGENRLRKGVMFLSLDRDFLLYVQILKSTY